MIYLLFIIFLTEIATDLYVPALPLIQSYFQTSISASEMTMSFHLLGIALSQPIYGIVSDKWGRKKPLIAGIILFCTGSLMCALVQTIDQLILFRFIQGIGVGAAPVLGLAIVNDLNPGSKDNIKMISLLTMVISCSPILGPVLGSFLISYWGWPSLFLLVGTSALFSLPFLYSLKDTGTPAANLRFFDLRLPHFLNAYLVSTVWLFITFGPFILIYEEGHSLAYYGLAQAFTVVFYMAGGFITHRFADKIPFLLTGGVLAMATGTVTVLLPHLILGIALFELGLGIIRPILVNHILKEAGEHSGAAAGGIGFTEIGVSSLLIAFFSYLDFDKTSVLQIGVAASSALFMIYALIKNNSMRIIADR